MLLAAEALRGFGLETRILPANPPRLFYRDVRWKVVGLDPHTAPQMVDNPPAEAITPEQLAGRADLLHAFTPALVVVMDGGKTQRIVPERAERLGEWVVQPVLLSAHGADGDIRYTLRVGNREVLKSGPLTKARRAELELTWRTSDRPPTVWQRELFDRRNAAPEIPGRAAPRPGDRYAIVVSAGALVPDVLKTREQMLTSDAHTPVKDALERDLVFLGVKYQVDSDVSTAALIDKTKVQVAWTTPRITIVASEGKPGRATSIDALADRVEATGTNAREFQYARGMANDTIETRVMFEITRRPVISASTVLAHFKTERPDTPQRRLVAIAREARRLLAEEPIGTRVACRRCRCPPTLRGP